MPQLVTQVEGFKQSGKLLFGQNMTQEQGLAAAQRLTESGKPYHMTGKQETIDLVNTNKDVKQKAIEGWILTSEVNKYGGPVAVYLGGGLHVYGGDPGYRGWVVLAPCASEEASATPQAKYLRPDKEKGEILEVTLADGQKLRAIEAVVRRE